jgi:hypothetical protein
MQAYLRGLQRRVSFQRVPALCSFPGNKRADEEAKKAAGLGPEDVVCRGSISLVVVKGLIRKQVIMCIRLRYTAMALGTFRAFQGRRNSPT